MTDRDLRADLVAALREEAERSLGRDDQSVHSIAAEAVSNALANIANDLELQPRLAKRANVWRAA